MSRPSGAATIDAMSLFLIEVHLPNAGKAALERAARMLEAAQARMPGVATVTVMAGLTHEDAWLVCLTEVTTAEAARRLGTLALLPPPRIREITYLAGTPLASNRYPRGDVHPGIEPELVEDVVDVGLNGALRKE